MKKSYLAIGPLPPPIGGDSISFSRLIESKIFKEENIKIEVIDTSRKDSESQIGRRLQLLDIINGFKYVVRAYSYRNKVDGILIWANSRFSYTIGLILIGIFAGHNKKVILKLFGSSFKQKFLSLPKWFQFVVKKVFSKTDYILPQTKNLCDFFINCVEINPNKIIQLPNFLPFNPVMKKNTFPGEKIRCVFVGQIKREKGIFEIMEALKNTPSFSCDFYGSIFEKDKTKFKEWINLLSNARYRGIVDKKEVIETISRYDVLLLPTFYSGEGYPGVILEAFFAGIPVITTKWLSIPEIVKDGFNGFLIAIKSPEELSIRLLNLKENKEMYFEMCMAAHKSAFEFTEEKVLKSVLLPLLK